MFTPKIKLSDTLYEKIKLASEIQGATSPDELAEKLLTVEVDKILQKAGKSALNEKDVEDIANRMKGLGYLE